ncbi:MAG: polysaccharide pyruvyl transferase family protein, partial [Candidatus Thorarchaeota archaeon]
MKVLVIKNRRIIKLRTLVVGWYGHGNIGDELLSIASYKILKDAFGHPPVIASVNPQVSVHSIQEMISGANPKIVQWPESMGLQSLASLGVIRTLANIMASESVCIGGGGMLSDWKGSKVHRWLEFISLCKKIGKKTALLGIGAGPFFDKTIADRIGTIINNDVDLIITRDHESKRYLIEDAGVNKQISVITDLAFYLTDIVRRKSNKNDSLVGNFVPFSDLSSEYVENIVTFLQKASQNRIVKLLPFHESDLRFHQMLEQRTGSSNVQALPLGSTTSVIDTLNSCKTAILTRFHAIVLGAILGIPLVPLVYHHKSSELVRVMELTDYS